jgi:hypothetical protein
MKTLLIALSLLASLPVWAEWTYIVTNQRGDKFYLDMKTIRKDGSLRKVWELVEFSKKTGFGGRSIRSRGEYDCKNERYRQLSMAAFAENMADGDVITTDNDTKEWQDIAPETAQNILQLFLCNK